MKAAKHHGLPAGPVSSELEPCGRSPLLSTARMHFSTNLGMVVFSRWHRVSRWQPKTLSDGHDRNEEKVLLQWTQFDSADAAVVSVRRILIRFIHLLYYQRSLFKKTKSPNSICWVYSEDTVRPRPDLEPLFWKGHPHQRKSHFCPESFDWTLESKTGNGFLTAYGEVAVPHHTCRRSCAGCEPAAVRTSYLGCSLSLWHFAALASSVGTVAVWSELASARSRCQQNSWWLHSKKVQFIPEESGNADVSSDIHRNLQQEILLCFRHNNTFILKYIDVYTDSYKINPNWKEWVKTEQQVAPQTHRVFSCPLGLTPTRPRPRSCGLCPEARAESEDSQLPVCVVVCLCVECYQLVDGVVDHFKPVRDDALSVILHQVLTSLTSFQL